MDVASLVINTGVVLFFIGIIIYGGLLAYKKLRTEWNSIPQSKNSRNEPRVIDIKKVSEGEPKWITNQSRKLE